MFNSSHKLGLAPSVLVQPLVLPKRYNVNTQDVIINLRVHVGNISITQQEVQAESHDIKTFILLSECIKNEFAKVSGIQRQLDNKTKRMNKGIRSSDFTEMLKIKFYSKSLTS